MNRLAGAGAVVVAAVSITFAAAWTHRAAAAATPDGKAIYSQKCSSCHHADGAGGGPFPALAGNKDVNAADPKKMLGIIKNGSGLMPAWKSQLSNAEIAAVSTYIRTSWGNKGGPVSESDVAAVK